MQVHIFQTGLVCVSPYLPFGGNCNILQAMGLTTPHSQWLWLPVFCYLIETPRGRVLVDTGWSRTMSPNGVLDRQAQIRSLGNYLLYRTNQGVVPNGQTACEHLAAMGLGVQDIDYILLTHLDCDHANGLMDFRQPKHVLCSEEELQFAQRKSLINSIRYQKQWWQNAGLQTFRWNGTEGPYKHSFDLFGDGSVVAIHLPGHADGQCAVRIQNTEGDFVLLTADAGYACRSWKDIVPSGIAANRKQQMQSLLWLHEQSLLPNCRAMLASHDTEVKEKTIEI